MYSLSISLLTSNKIDRLTCAINQAYGTCWGHAFMLANDHMQIPGTDTDECIVWPTHNISLVIL